MIERKEMPTKLAGSVSGHVHCASHAKTDSHTIFTHTFISVLRSYRCGSKTELTAVLIVQIQYCAVVPPAQLC